MTQLLLQAETLRPQPALPIDHIRIGIAATAKEKEKIYRLRYSIYVEEMAKRLAYADHQRRRLVDDMDDWGILLYAEAGGEIIGTLRLHIGAVNDFSPQLAAAFTMDKFTGRPQAPGYSPLVAFISKGMVVPQYRNSQVFNLLIGAFYEICRRRDVTLCFVGCAPYLVPIYERHGARRYKPSFFVPDYGCMVPLAYLLDDLDHFRRVSSPFLPLAAGWPHSPAATAWLTGAFPETDNYANRALLDRQSQWQLLSAALGQAPEKAVGIFRGLSREDAITCAEAGHIYLAGRDETLVHPFDMSNELFVVLSGTVTLGRQLSPRRQATVLLKPGQAFGKKAFIDYSRQNMTVTAQSEAQILIIARNGMSRLEAHHPAIAAKLLHNIGVRAAKKYA